MVEYTKSEDRAVEVLRPISSGDNVVPAGSEALRGERLVSPGVRMNHAAAAVAASVGQTHVLVYDKPKVAVLATGDEIVDVAAHPAPYQIRNSNSFSLAAQIEASGGEAVIHPAAPDEPKKLEALVRQGFESELLLLSGGVSMGKYDLVEEVLQDLGAEFLFTSVQIQPGRPLVFGRVEIHGRQKYFFGLPGNPVSTMVTYELFARALVEALAGLSPRKLVFPKAKLKSLIKTRTGLTRFLPAILTGEFEDAAVELVKWQGSGDVVSAARANCYAVIPPHRERFEPGELLSIFVP
jgi:molybdopterin molybdotransferase